MEKTTANDGLERAFVLGWWALLTAAALGFIAVYAVNAPFGDDWLLVPQLSGAEPLSAAWLWAPLNEHRFPVAKLALYALSELTRGEYRAGMAAGVVLLSAAALAAILAARRVRGRTSYADAFFPLLLLHWGHRASFLWNIQLFWMVAAANLCALVVGVMSGAWARRPVVAGGWALLLVLLPLHGGMGLAAMPPLALWAAAVGWAAWRSGSRSERRAGAALMGGALIAVAVAALYLLGLAGVGGRTPSSPAMVALTALRALSMGLGPPPQLRLWWLPACLIGLMALASLGLLAHALRTRPDDRLRAAGLLASFAAVCSLLLAIGVGRAYLGLAGGLATRYSVVALALPFVCYCVWVVYGQGRKGEFVQVLVFSLACVALGVNTLQGMGSGRVRQQAGGPLLQGIRSGLPPALLARDHGAALSDDLERVAVGLEMLRRTRRGPYRDVPVSADAPYSGAPNAPSPAASLSPATPSPASPSP